MVVLQLYRILLYIITYFMSDVTVHNYDFQSLRRQGNVTFLSRRSRELDFILDGKEAYEVKHSATNRDVNRTEKLSKECSLESWHTVSLEYSNNPDVLPAFLV